MELAKGRTGDEVFNGGKEVFLGHLDGQGMGTEFAPNANELLDAALAAKRAHLAIERIGCEATLKDVAQNKRVSATLMVGAAIHKV